MQMPSLLSVRMWGEAKTWARIMRVGVGEEEEEEEVEGNGGSGSGGAGEEGVILATMRM